MMETIDLGPTPSDEPCAHVGTDDYELRSRLECRVYKDQLERLYVERFGRKLPESVHVKVKNFPHELGDYREVVVRFDDADQSAIDAAFWLEENAPSNWDDNARELLDHAEEACCPS